MKTIKNCEYIYLTCLECAKGETTEAINNDPWLRVKIAKNKGAYWKTYNGKWLDEFLIMHGNCDRDKIVLMFEE